MKGYYLDLFSGIGGFALGAYWSDLRFTGHYFIEIEPYAVELYKIRFPESIPLGDIQNVDYSKLPKGEWLVTGGFPCQPHSVAGNKKGYNDERDLWTECARMLRELRPAIALFENVPGLFNSNDGQFFNRVLSDISESGYDCEWQIISAADIGAPHLRKRLWIVAYPNGKRFPSNKQRGDCFRKNSQKKPNEWEQLLAITSRDYSIQHWKENEQIITGTYDGIPEELDAIKGAGNAIVPQIAEIIMNIPAFDIWRTKELLA